MNLKTGTVLYPADKILETKYGQKQTVKIKFEDGTEETIWCGVGQKPHTELKKGDAVQVLFEDRNGKTSKRLITSNDINTATNTQQNNNQSTNNRQMNVKISATSEEKQLIAEYVRNSADLYAFCLKTVMEKMSASNGEQPPMITDENGIRAVATSLFIATQKKFNL